MADKAIALFQEISQPNDIMMTLLFNACAELGNDEGLNQMKKVLDDIPQSSYSNVRLVTSLLDALMKCGDINRAESLFAELTTKELSMYGAMIKGNIELQIDEKGNLFFDEIGYRANEMWIEVLDLFNELKRTNLLQEKEIKKRVNKLDDMESKLTIYHCIINASSQLGMLSMSEGIIDEIPFNIQMNSSIQNCLIDMWVKISNISF